MKGECAVNLCLSYELWKYGLEYVQALRVICEMKEGTKEGGGELSFIPKEEERHL